LLASQISVLRKYRWPSGGSDMAGRIGSVQKAQDGLTYGFVVYDTADRACVYLGFSTWHDADRAAREAQGLLVTALVCVRR
jgi:hypothetical protein